MNTWKPEGLLVAVDDRRRSVKEASELLRDTCSLILVGHTVIWNKRKGMTKVSRRKDSSSRQENGLQTEG